MPDKEYEGEIISPEAAARERASLEIERERGSMELREGAKWHALVHVLIVFGALAIGAFAAILSARTFGVIETALGLVGAGVASVIAFVYIYNAANRTVIRER